MTAASTPPETPEPVGAVRVAVRALGVPLDIVVPDALEHQVRQIWHLCRDDRSHPGDVREVRAAVPQEADDSRASVLQSLTRSVTLAAIESRAGTAVMFHAGGLSHPTSGASIVYVAPGGTGKT